MESGEKSREIDVTRFRLKLVLMSSSIFLQNTFLDLINISVYCTKVIKVSSC